VQISNIKFSDRKAFRLLLCFNALLIALGIVFLSSPARAVNLEVVGQTNGTTSYYLHMKSSDIVFVECAGSSNEASLGYLSSQQAITCP
jgi:hypothetical protein